MKAWHFPKLPDWLIYVAVVAALLTAALSRREHANAPEAPPPPGAGEGALLAPASPFDRALTIKGGGAPLPSAGTAFSVSDKGVWVTARHVVQGCGQPVLMVAPGRGVAAKVRLDLDSDVAILSTEGGAPALPLGLNQPLRVGARGYHPGFPQGRAGEAASRLLGRQALIAKGRGAARKTAQPVVAWAQAGRTEGMVGGLSGLSGAPVLDSAGRVVGVTIAEAPRRGRIYTAAPESLLQALAQSKVQVTAPPPTDPITVENYGRAADGLRRALSVVQVTCLAGAPAHRG
ncbi:MAG: serine protease [Caulobacteraceae bacterium]